MSSLFDFSDPTTMQLLGLAAGFGQASAPSRLPVTSGMAFGGAAQGLLAAQQAARQMQLTQAQANNLNSETALRNLQLQGYGAMRAPFSLAPAASGGTGTLPGIGGTSSGGTPVTPAAMPAGMPGGTNMTPAATVPRSQVLASPTQSGGGTGGPAPMFDTGDIMNQAWLAARYGLPFANNLFDLAKSVATTTANTGVYMAADGSIHRAPGADQAETSKMLAGKGYRQNPDGSWYLDPALITGTAQLAGAEAWAKAPAEVYTESQKPIPLRGQGSGAYFPSTGQTVQIPTVVRSIDPTTQREITTIRPLGLTDANGNPIGGAPASGGGAGSLIPPGYVNAVTLAESGGNPNAVPRDATGRPLSTAQGPGQFLDRTWGTLMMSHPELGLTPDGRTDPQQAARATAALAQDNARQLTQALGRPPSGPELYVAHAFGADGAIRFLSADPNSPATANASPDAVRANPYLFYGSNLRVRSTGDVLNALAQRYTSALARSGTGAVAAPQPYGAPSGATGQSFVSGLSPLERSSAEKRGAELEDLGAEVREGAANAVNNQFLVDQLRRESGNGAGWEPGRFADWIGDVRSMLQGALGDKYSPDSLTTALGSYQAFQKNAMQLTTQATRAVSPKAAVQEMQMIREALPNAKLSNGGLGYIFDQLTANNQFSIAKAQGAQAWRSGHGGTLDGFEENWDTHISPFAFLAHTMDAPSLQTMLSNLSQTAKGRALVARIRSETAYASQNGLFTDEQQANAR